MTKRGDALIKAFETTATPGRSIIDILTTSDTTCTACEGPGGQLRRWYAPIKDVLGRWQVHKKDGEPVPNKAGFLCDDCEALVRRALVYLRAGRITKAIQEVERVAS